MASRKPTLAFKAITYCRRDTEITGRFVESMMRKYDEIGCRLKTTIAATTLDYFESQFYQRITHGFTEEQIDFFHRGYYGGRTEIFHNKPIRGPLWYHDINSLYPHCLKTGQFPNLERFYETIRIDLRANGMADVQIQAPEDLQIPYLPHKSQGKLIFPLGKWRGVYTFFELREAQKLGYEITKVHRAIEFPESHNPFEEFIDSIYRERLKAQSKKDELLNQVFKAFGNHAYGKYAQGNEVIEMVPLKTLRKIPDGTVILGGELALIKRRRKYPRYANCIWASYTTVLARHALYRALQLVSSSGARLVYCDTDSVIYANPTQIIPHSNALGEFKLEGVFKEGYFKLPKLYKLIPYENAQHIYRTKGVPRSASKRYFTNNKARFKKPNKLRESLRRNLSKSKKWALIPNFWEVREKEINSVYTKRRVLKDGSTLPLILEEEQT